LKELAGRALLGEQLLAELDKDSGLYVQAFPLYYRERITGAVMACSVSDDFLNGDNYLRFCSIHEIDRLVAEKLAVSLPRHPKETIRTYADILRNHMESFIDSALARGDVHDLSSHLAGVYEEISLIFRVSTDITVSKGPEAYFNKLCDDLCEATDIEAVVAILNSPSSMFDRTHIIKSGNIPVNDEQLTRLYHQVLGTERNAGRALVVNDVGANPAYGWLDNWARSFMFFDLACGNQNFGGLLAINRTDTGDFGSQQVQLLNTIVERSAAFLENVRLYNDLEQLMMGMLHALISSTDAKDPYTCGHSQRVAFLSRHLATLDGKSEDICHNIYLSGLLHDIGKIGVPESVLCKTGKLTVEEFDQMKRHTEIGARIVGQVRQVEDLVPGIMHHHERIDGKGYPSQISGEDIPYFGRVIGLADSFDAMTSNRTYRNALPTSIAVAEIRKYAGTQFDPVLADILLKEDVNTLRSNITASDNLTYMTGPVSAKI